MKGFIFPPGDVILKSYTDTRFSYFVFFFIIQPLKLKKLEKYIPWDTRIMPEDEVNNNYRALNLKPEVLQAARKIAKNFVLHGIEEGKKPRTIAGVCFFMAIMKTADHANSNNENLILSEISKVVNIEVNTI